MSDKPKLDTHGLLAKGIAGGSISVHEIVELLSHEIITVNEARQLLGIVDAGASA